MVNLHEVVKLFEIPKNSKIKLHIIGEKEDLGVQMCTFGHLDGAYSYIETPQGDTVHLSASTPLKLVREGGKSWYEIVKEDEQV